VENLTKQILFFACVGLGVTLSMVSIFGLLSNMLYKVEGEYGGQLFIEKSYIGLTYPRKIICPVENCIPRGIQYKPKGRIFKKEWFPCVDTSEGKMSAICKYDNDYLTIALNLQEDEELWFWFDYNESFRLPVEKRQYFFPGSEVVINNITIQ